MGSSDDNQSDDAGATATTLREELNDVDEVLMLPQTQPSTSSRGKRKHGAPEPAVPTLRCEAVRAAGGTVSGT